MPIRDTAGGKIIVRRAEIRGPEKRSCGIELGDEHIAAATR